MPEDSPTSPSDVPPPDLREEREQFLKSFSKGAQLTKEFLEQYETLQRTVLALESENTKLRSAIEAEDAIRQLIRTIEALEVEKRELLSQYQKAQEASSGIAARFDEMETELANFANLHVASNCLHSSMSPRGVARRIKEVLEQLMGIEAYGIYLKDSAEGRMIPVAHECVSPEELAAGAPAERLASVARSGAADIDESVDPSRGTLSNPPAMVPLRIDDSVVGVIIVVRCLGHKTRFSTVDYELFKLLGQHAAFALMSSGLYAQAGRKLPRPSDFSDLAR